MSLPLAAPAPDVDTDAGDHFARSLSRILARTLHGFTWRRVAIFFGAVTFLAMGAGLMTLLRPERTWLQAAWTFMVQFLDLTALLGAVGAGIVVAGNWAPSRTIPRVLVLAGGTLAGLVAGYLLQCVVYGSLGLAPGIPMPFRERLAIIVLWSHVIAAGMLGYFYFLLEEETVARLHDEALRGEALEREFAEARLSVMQAQVEPHFLFNTLANVRRLFVTDPDAARAMLQQLSRYLGALLPRMRRSDSTLGQELALAMAYLSVQKIRMGSRLTVHTAVPDALAHLPFPPMMLVTLVENAIRHGLTPLPNGGEVRIVARAVDGKLRVAVSDTGVGLSEGSGSGVGLANIRARLASLFGGEARLLLMRDPGGGVTAAIEVPAGLLHHLIRAA